jgi:hypothetical protein
MMSATAFFPRLLSRKKRRASGGFELELAPDRFFDFVWLAAIVVS